MVAFVAVTTLTVAACGGGGSGTNASGGRADDLVVEVASYDLAVGPAGRFILGALTADHRFVGFGTVQLRFAYLGSSRATERALAYELASTGTFLPLPGTEAPDPAPARPTIVDTDTGRGVYATTVGFDRAGLWQVEVRAPVGGRQQQAAAVFVVREHHAVPALGDRAGATENLTLASTDVPRAAIDSRATNGDIPDPELHRTTIAAALAAHRPVVVVFSTPVFCISRFCGPLTELVQQLAREYADRASFVHIEIWLDHDNNKINQAAADWLYRNGDLNEPWVYVIGADGAIAARFDNIVTRRELESILRQLPVIGAQ